MHTEFLDQMAGSRARLWEFTASHDRLTIEIKKDGSRLRYASFVMCERIQAPVLWLVRSPLISIENGFIIYRDDQAEIQCSEISLDAH